MSKDEIKNLLIDFVCEYDMTSWNNDKVYEKFSDLIYKGFGDLEAKLAVADDCADRYWKQLGVLEEENKKLKEFIEKRENCNEWLTLKDNENLENEVKQLKQQLAEKEKELRYKTAECEKWKTDYENCSKLEKMMTKERQYCLDNWRASDQDKISFAVEQMEKVRKTIKNLHGQKNVKIGNSYIQKKDKLYNKYIIELDILENVLEIFDNQINELKEKK